MFRVYSLGFTGWPNICRRVPSIGILDYNTQIFQALRPLNYRSSWKLVQELAGSGLAIGFAG